MKGSSNTHTKKLQAKKINPHSHLSDQLSFKTNQVITKSIKYKNIRLYFQILENQTFSTLRQQYRNITSQELEININGLVLNEKIRIDSIIESQSELQLFQILLNNRNQNVFMLEKKYEMDLNMLIYKIMRENQRMASKSQKEEVNNHNSKRQLMLEIQSENSKIKQITSNVESSLPNLKILQLKKQSEKKSTQNLDTSVTSVSKSFIIKNQSQKIQQKPSIKTRKIIYWIDDEPKNNINVIKKYFIDKNIEVNQVVSTKNMINIIKENKQLFYGTQQINKKQNQSIQLLFISDMTRKQQNLNLNFQAGIDLFFYIYNQFKSKIPAILYVNQIISAYTKIQKRKLDKNFILVLNQQKDLIKQVYKIFKI